MATTKIGSCIGKTPDEVPYCRGTICDKQYHCSQRGECLYKSSADEAREAREQKEEDVDIGSDLGGGTPTGRVCVMVETQATLSTDPKERKNTPMARGLLDYFPNALAYVAQVSAGGNAQHNLGADIHWARGKSTDHPDCIIRHLVDRGTFDKDNIRHSGKVAWRALALLEEELEAEGAKPGRASRFPDNA